jgi:hypothetical protein
VIFHGSQARWGKPDEMLASSSMYRSLMGHWETADAVHEDLGRTLSSYPG